MTRVTKGEEARQRYRCVSQGSVRSFTGLGDAIKNQKSTTKNRMTYPARLRWNM